MTNDAKEYLQRLLNKNGFSTTAQKSRLFDAFIAEDGNTAAVVKIIENQKILIQNWKIKNRVDDIIRQSFMIPNGTIGKAYEAKIDFRKLGWSDFVDSAFEGLEEIGLSYDQDEDMIRGTPTNSGDFKIKLKFRITDEKPDSEMHEKQISLVINPDPKSLWKDIPSDTNALYWKEDNVTAGGKLGDRHIVVASKRGRSHANVGSFRDDDFAFKFLENSGWSVVAVADGAGSAKLSRKGSELACQEVINYFETNFTPENLKDFDEVLQQYGNGTVEDEQKKLSHFIYNNLSKAAHAAHKKIAEFAHQHEDNLKDYYSTLIFALFKKYEKGYAVLSFGVGDCPIGLLNKDKTQITLMNWLDVGEFGGGTRFINMPEIFTSDKFVTRFKFKMVEDFSYLMLMTDGIYDPKFVVEVNLEKIDKWNGFLDDLEGQNDDNCKVELAPGNADIESQLSKWMDFWSPGNHDDRTLAIVF